MGWDGGWVADFFFFFTCFFSFFCEAEDWLKDHPLDFYFLCLFQVDQIYLGYVVADPGKSVNLGHFPDNNLFY